MKTVVRFLLAVFVAAFVMAIYNLSFTWTVVAIVDWFLITALSACVMAGYADD